ncbi:IS5 family transposase [Streptomyces anulatus]|uniref:IS5 family transposase n=1 Tax=Streptomyces anulatus TaxID=1892 RepID=UPI003441BFD9
MRKGEQLPWIVPDGLWQRIEPLLPTIERRYRNPGRKRIDDRKALCGILFVLYTAIPWEFLPQELGFGSGMTCWRRLRDWHQAGVWNQLHELLLAELHAADRLDWSKAVIDSSQVRALKGGPKTGPSPVDRGKTGSKHHVITDGNDIPLAVSLGGGNRNDILQLMPLIEAIPPVRGKVGKPRRRPKTLYADRAYDHDRYRRQLREKRIEPIIPRRGTPHGSGLGVHRWVVEQTIALLHWFRRLRIRWATADLLTDAVRHAASAVTVTVPDVPGEPARVFR